MFNQIRNRLLLSYLAVLTAILSLFAIAVRTTFFYSLNQQLHSRLATLARAAALELELDGGEVVVDIETLTNAKQAVQWFDVEGNLLETQGEYVVTLPFDPDQPRQSQTRPYPAKAFTIAVNDYDKGVFIGYTRVSESTADLNNTLRSLDWGLGGGVAMALALSGLGGLWLSRQAMQPIEQSFQRLQRFTADASHELRSPLMAIQTNAAVALKYPDNMRPSDAEKFQAIKGASDQMKALTEDLLLLARLDQSAAVEREPINLALILKQLQTRYQLQADTQQIRLKTQIAPDLPTTGNKVQLTRLLTNLIDNALRYTPAGGAVEVIAQRQEARLIISVADTGIGIAPEQLKHIFERFWQADQARSYQTGGVGLGLSIAQNIAHSHGGAIAVTSQLGQGTCFTVELPGEEK